VRIEGCTVGIIRVRSLLRMVCGDSYALRNDDDLLVSYRGMESCVDGTMKDPCGALILTCIANKAIIPQAVQ
jgi:hypothetical protein